MVIVVTPLSVHKHITRDLFAARLEELGLTAYATSESVAVDRVKRMFNRFVVAYRQDGLLEEKLNHVDAEWYWKSDYPLDAKSYEDTNNLGGQPNVPVAKRRTQRANQPVQSQYVIVPMSQRLAA